MSLYRLRGASVRLAGDVVVRLPDLEVADGERIAVVGPNGCGKTTLLRVLAFLVRPQGEFAAQVAPHEVAWLAQRPFLLRGSVVENVEYALAARHVHRAERHRRARAALERLGAADLASRPRRALSEGQVQRVAIARAIVTEPAVLLLDEPLGPLDADGAARVADVVADPRLRAVVVAAPAEDGLPARVAWRVMALSG